MKSIMAAAALTLALAFPAFAALENGAKAPDFTVQAALAGKAFTFSLSEALKSGPVVLFFYPKAFTKGCTVEANAFSEATDDFKKLGATVIGISTDKIKTLKKFSVTECRNKFAVAADPDMKVTKAYDAVLLKWPGYADRTSYVIAPDSTVLYSFTDLNPEKHVDNTMKAVRDWHAKQVATEPSPPTEQ